MKDKTDKDTSNTCESAVYFVASVHSFKSKATSTDIMTANLVKGINETTKVVLFLICEIEEEIQDVVNYYEQYSDQVVVLTSAFGYNLNKYTRLCNMLFRAIDTRYYRRELRKIFGKVKYRPELIIAHVPSVEAVYYATELKKEYKVIPYYQFWSDPITLSGITPEKVGIKRKPFQAAESRMLNDADNIIYGTKPLMNFQKKLFQKHSQKMHYIDIPFSDRQTIEGEIEKNSLLYAGNYYSKYRNLKPLIEAVEEIKKYKLDVYGQGDIPEIEMQYTNICGKVPVEEIEAIENSYEYIVCILNHNCIQIPGKIFYNMNRKGKIMVIADGEYGKEIAEYLREHRRFIICENTKDEILSCLSKNEGMSADVEYVTKNYNAKKIAIDLLNGGLS